MDLEAPDEIVVENFMTWLKDARSSADIPSARLFNAMSYDKWNKHKILPYFDLKLWAQYRGFQISNEEFGDLLFADDAVDRSEKIRKTTKGLANRIFSNSTERSIKWQLVSERAEQPERK